MLHRAAGVAARIRIPQCHLRVARIPLRIATPSLGVSRRGLCTSSDFPSCPYSVLGLQPGASPAQVKDAYYRLAMVYHPDRNQTPDASKHFAAIGVAYNSILGVKEEAIGPRDSQRPNPEPPPFVSSMPMWADRAVEELKRIGLLFDLWLMPSYSSVIYHHLRAGELADALRTYEEMRREGEIPSHAVFEMLIRGCTIAMRRPGIGCAPDHLTSNMVRKVIELWGEMQAVDRQPTYLTYIELIRAFGKAGAIPQAMTLFEKMCSNVWLLPETRALDSMYEVCVRSGAYKEALKVFEEHEELRKSLWNPRYTPVSFSLLLTATAEIGPEPNERLQKLPRVLELMGGAGIHPRVETCNKLLSTTMAAGELGIADLVIKSAERARHTLDPKLCQELKELKEQDKLPKEE